MPDYYRVPVTEDEIHRIQFVGGDNTEKYFKQIVSSPRPDHLAPLILFERDGDYPDELFGIVYNADGMAVHFLYISDKSMLLPHMKKFKTGGFRISIPEFLAFKRENSNIRSFFKDRLKLPTLLENQIEPSTPAPTPIIKQYSLERMVVLILIALCFYFLFHKKKETPDMDPLKQFIQQIEDPEKKKKFMDLVDGLAEERRDVLMAHFERAIRDKNKKKLLVDYINKSLMNDKVLLELETFFSSIHNAHTKRMLKQIIYQTAGRRPPRRTYKPIQEQVIFPQKTRQQETSKTEPPLFTMDKLYDFLKNNKQTIVSSYGAVSPYFSTKLTQFLETQHAEDPSRLVRSVTTNASRLMKKDKTLTHRQLTDRLLHTITEQELQQIHSFPEPTISPVSKRRARRRVRIEPATMIQQQQKQERKQQEPEWKDLVERIARTTQTELGVAVVDANIHNITHNSKTFKKIAPTLRDVILSRQIKKVNVIDAPNLLTPYFNTYQKRQKYSRDLKFAKKLRQQMDKDSLIVVVSQMNRSEWVKDDPVYFGRIGPDELNIFLVRVGCFDETNDKDCYKSENTGRHNECDDFVRLDIIARTIDLLQQQGHAMPEFVQWTNDKSRNWTIIDPTHRQHLRRSSMSL